MKKTYQSFFIIFLGWLWIYPQNGRTEATKSNQTQKATDFFLSYQKCVEKVKSPFRLEARTEYIVSPILSSKSENKTNTQRYSVVIQSDGKENFSIKYQTEDAEGKHKAGGEAIWTQNQFYRRLFDTPFIHRSLEQGELTKLFAAQDQTQALLELLSPYAHVEKKTSLKKQERLTSEVRFTLEPKGLSLQKPETQETQELEHSRKQWRKKIKINELQALFIIDEKTQALLTAQITSSFELPSQKKVTIHHELELTFLEQPFSIAAPSAYQEAPFRKRYYQQEQRKQLLEKQP